MPVRPRVVLLDTDHWDSLRSLAAALRHRGASTARVTVRGRGLRSVVGRALDAAALGPVSAYLPARDAELPAAVFATATADVQGPDDVLDRARRRADFPADPRARRVPVAADEDLLFDKLLMQWRAETLAVAVPQAWTVPPDRAPLVVKGRVGFGGQTVRLAMTADEVSLAAAALPAPVFFQEFRPGTVVNFGGVARDGRLLAGAAYQALPAPGDPLGPPERIAVVESERLLADLRVLVADLRYTGFLCVDFIVAPDGSPAMIDFNPRVFASWLALQTCGVPVLEAYLSLLGLAPEPDPERAIGAAGPIAYVRIWPRSTVRSLGEVVGEARHSARSLAAVAPWTGARFVVASAARDTVTLATATARILRDRVRGRRGRA